MNKRNSWKTLIWTKIQQKIMKRGLVWRQPLVVSLAATTRQVTLAELDLSACKPEVVLNNHLNPGQHSGSEILGLSYFCHSSVEGPRQCLLWWWFAPSSLWGKDKRALSGLWWMPPSPAPAQMQTHRAYTGRRPTAQERPPCSGWPQTPLPGLWSWPSRSCFVLQNHLEKQKRGPENF